IIPGSLVMTIFPAFSTLGLTRIKDLRFYFIRATKYVFLTVGLIALILMLFAHEILKAWLGNAFAQNSTLVIQILLFGVLISSLTHLALALFQGIGHPEITAKIQLLLLPISVLLSIILIKRIGIVGAALSWTFCRTIGMLMSWKVAWRIIQLDRTILIRNRILLEFIWFLTLAGLLLPLLFLNNIFVKSLGAMFVCIVFIIAGWRYILDAQDRSIMFVLRNRLLNRVCVTNCVSKGKD
ncbi:polysaccharide biosynthesis C-terminal domain-containing protein, partial [bacterium]|nr:polysaccharide biosynthesis C-terminal domain-containing protein [bacterium]